MLKQAHAALTTVSLILAALGAGCSGGASEQSPQEGSGGGSTNAPSAGSGGSKSARCIKGAGKTQQKLAERPNARLFLTDALLTRLRARAAAADAAWLELAKQCDEYSTGQMHPPSGTDYPGHPNVGEGYQGDEYLPVVRALGLCYQTVRGVDAAAEQRYGAAGARLLEAMSTPVSEGGLPPSTNSGYPIRHYAVGMALGYDWFYPVLTAAQKDRVIASLNTWIDWYDAEGFLRDEPIANYFTGYLLGKTLAALATEAENPKAPAYWQDVSTRLWGELVKPELGKNLAGGGWPEGWGYGKRAVLSIAETMWAASTAKGLRWWSELPQLGEQVRYVMHFAWPSLEHMDDQGTIRSGIDLRASAELASGLATVLRESGDPQADIARGFARDVIATAGDDRRAWAKFLFDDPADAGSPVTGQPLSYLAPGPGHVAMRSSWDKTAVWAELSGGPYINAPDSGEQLFNAGGMAVVRGDEPVIVNASGWIPQQAGTEGERFVYDDAFGKRERRLYNTFFVDDASNPYNPGQNNFGPEDSKAHVESFEDGVGYVRARARNLEDQYGWHDGSRPVSEFTRDLVYLRPGTFVVFDRTGVANAGADQWLAFHTAGAPSERQPGSLEFSVPGGSIASLLPAVEARSVGLPGGVNRLELHARDGQAAQRWLTVVNAGDTAPLTARLSPADGNVVAGDAVGVHVRGEKEQVVLFAAPDSAQVEYGVAQQADAEHVIANVAPSASGYAVTTTPNGAGLTVRVSPGGEFTPSAGGVLAVRVNKDGSVADTGWVPEPVADPTPPPPATPTQEPDTPPSDTSNPTTTVTATGTGGGSAGTGETTECE